MSDEYIDKAGLVLQRKGGWFGLAFPDDGDWVFPPLEEDVDGLRFGSEYWAGFSCDCTFSDSVEVLDRQYIYDSDSFHDLRGHHWSVFRKNIRKWPKYNYGSFIQYSPIFGDFEHNQISDLLTKWADRMGDIQDPEVLVRFVLYGNNRWGLFRNRELVGLNVADFNWRYVNYRYCIDNGEPFVQEYLRYRFYMSSWVWKARHQAKLLVNDGGDLDNEGLARFKRKLNPVQVLWVPTSKEIKDDAEGKS